MGACAQVLIIRGYQRERVTIASVMGYIEIPFAYLMQAFLFHDEVRPLSIIGTLLICSASATNLYANAQRESSKVSAGEMEQSRVVHASSRPEVTGALLKQEAMMARKQTRI